MPPSTMPIWCGETEPEASDMPGLARVSGVTGGEGTSCGISLMASLFKEEPSSIEAGKDGVSIRGGSAKELPEVSWTASALAPVKKTVERQEWFVLGRSGQGPAVSMNMKNR